MTKLTVLIKQILKKHVDPQTKTPELILLGWCDNYVASEHLSRYMFASSSLVE